MAVTAAQRRDRRWQMHIREILNSNRIAFSFEFFPPKDEASAADLFQTISELVPLGPADVSVTYGAGGSTRELTRDLVLRIQSETSLTVVSHLTCVGGTQAEIGHILEDFERHGIQNVMALRGDPPRGQREFTRTEGGFGYAAELVAFIRREFPRMGIGVAGYPEGHPETRNRLTELDHLRAKVDAGADYICTQLFFDNRDFYDFCERCELVGIRVPVLAGIMPVTSRRGMKRMADLAAGTHYPARLLRALARAEDDEHFEKVGIHWATEQVRDLVDHGVRGVHFYTLNRSRATLHIYDSLGVTRSESLMR
jgi:methylenetetrahydrofolate reductase (NADPH)